jgi:drug/metabolite transporter (DMT)-like permease
VPVKEGMYVGRSQSRQVSRGAACAIAASLLFGSSTPISKVFLSQIEPWILAGLFSLSAGIGLGIYYILSRGLVRKSSPDKNLEGKDWIWFSAATLAGGVTAPVLLMFGIANSPASSAALLLSLEGVLTALVAWSIFRERFDWRLALGMAAIIAGSVVISSAKYSEFKVSWGSLAVIGACLSWGIDNNLTRQISHKNPLQIATIKSCIAGVVNITLALALGESLPSPPLLLVTSVIGVLNYGMSLILFVLALRYIGASRTGAFFSLAPFAGAVLSVIVLGDSVTYHLVAAGGLIALGMLVMLI